jgi:hypothetical protein
LIPHLGQDPNCLRWRAGCPDPRIEA